MMIIIGTSIYCHAAITKKNVGTMLVRKKWLVRILGLAVLNERREFENKENND